MRFEIIFSHVKWSISLTETNDCALNALFIFIWFLDLLFANFMISMAGASLFPIYVS